MQYQDKSWAKNFGMFADDPTFDDFLEEVAAYRQSVDAESEVARQRFMNHSGEINLGYETGSDNESIDSDLAKA